MNTVKVVNLADKPNNNIGKPKPMNQAKTFPILYSLRNCPYAMRARVAVFKAKQTVLLRDLVLSNKPKAMIEASPKATVPVLVLTNGVVIEESLAVMLWAFQQTDPNNVMHSHIDNALPEMLAIINDFDHGFKQALNQYKCTKRYLKGNNNAHELAEHREKCEQFIAKIEQRLTKHTFLMSDRESLADIAIFPFIRQFARVERQWYLQSPYPKVRQWLNNYLQSPMFTKVMAKYPLWLDSHQEILFGDV
jgi:glutathione S-transferase